MSSTHVSRSSRCWVGSAAAIALNADLAADDVSETVHAFNQGFTPCPI
jgi:hypothetical protein